MALGALILARESRFLVIRERRADKTGKLQVVVAEAAAVVIGFKPMVEEYLVEV